MTLTPLGFLSINLIPRINLVPPNILLPRIVASSLLRSTISVYKARCLSVLDDGGTTDTTSAASSNETDLGTGARIPRHGPGLANMLRLC